MGFTVAWRFTVQSTTTLPLNATPSLLLSAETMCPCWPVGVPSGYSYTPVGPEPSRCCWWAQSKEKERSGFHRCPVLSKAALVCRQTHTGILWKTLSCAHILALLSFNFLFHPESSLTTRISHISSSGLSFFLRVNSRSMYTASYKKRKTAGQIRENSLKFGRNNRTELAMVSPMAEVRDEDDEELISSVSDLVPGNQTLPDSRGEFTG